MGSIDVYLPKKWKVLQLGDFVDLYFSDMGCCEWFKCRIRVVWIGVIHNG